MIKHTIGFALFSSIVAATAFVFGFFYSPPPAPQISHCQRPVRMPAKVKDDDSPIIYELRDLNIDLEKGTGSAKLQLTWNADFKSPGGIRFDFGLVTVDNPTSGIQVGSCQIANVFTEGKTVTKQCSFRLWTTDLDLTSNYYGYAEITDRNNDGVTKLVYKQKDLLAESVPVLLKHPKKK